MKLFYGASQRGVRSIGSDVILKDRPDEGAKARIEAKTLEFLARGATATDANINILSPKLIHDWVDRDGRYFTLTERIHGQTLEQVWPSLSESQRIFHCRSGGRPSSQTASIQFHLNYYTKRRPTPPIQACCF